jgi:hypothetical protein
MKPHTEMIEGPEAAKRFDATMRTLLSVPRSELKRREEEYQKAAAANPKKRGPKKKV